MLQASSLTKKKRKEKKRKGYSYVGKNAFFSHILEKSAKFSNIYKPFFYNEKVFCVELLTELHHLLRNDPFCFVCLFVFSLFFSVKFYQLKWYPRIKYKMKICLFICYMLLWMNKNKFCYEIWIILSFFMVFNYLLFYIMFKFHFNRQSVFNH